MVSMAAVEHATPEERDEDQRIVLHDVSWSDFEAVLAAKGESNGVRVTYLRGELELMSPSTTHETRKKFLARLVEAYAEEANIDLNGVGSWTIKDKLKKLGVEPDECYIVGDREAERPDIAIEVVWTSGGLPKLDVYEGLGVREVWFYHRAERLTFHALRAEGYVETPRSELLPDLDPRLLERYARESNQTAAVRAFRAELQASAMKPG